MTMFTDTPDTRGEFVVGAPCGQCHDVLTAQKLPVAEGHLAMSLFADTPITDVFLGYDTHSPPTSSTPLPGTLLLLALPLALMLRRAR